MRNLKKILALVLALVMSLSLMATAGAADFSDKDQITDKYSDAVTVLNGLEVFKGYDNGARFEPQGDITRAEVAAIIYRIATGDVSDTQKDIYSTWGLFTDVADGSWYAGYVNYCANAGYIKGRGNKIFDPNGKVTGYEALAMILRAIGYDKNNEFSGSNWQVNTASIAKQRGITNNITDTLLGQAATREVVAEILFQAILVPTVTFNTATISYTNNATSLGKDILNLDKVTGVVVANEYANVQADDLKVLAKGKTQLRVAAGDVRTLDLGTDLTDIGMSENAYIQGSKVLLISEGDNTVFDNTDKSGEHVDIGTNSKFASVSGMSKNDGTEFFVNFDHVTRHEANRRIEVRVTFNGEQAEKDFDGYDTIDISKIAKTNGYTVYQSNSTSTFRKIEITGDDYVPANVNADSVGKYEHPVTYEMVFKVDDELTDDDLSVIKTIFAMADDRESSRYGISGSVYVGTNSQNYVNSYIGDKSDDMSYSAFKAEYINDVVDKKWSTSDDGEWVKIIDNNGDGIADYAFLTTFTLDKAVSTYTSGDKSTLRYYDLDLINDDDIDQVAYMNEVAEGDVVLHTVIDAQALVWKADTVEDTITKINDIYKRSITATTSNGDVYTQSEIDNATRLEQLLSQMSENVNYRLYLDAFGRVRAYEPVDGNKYALLTEMYWGNYQNNRYVVNDRLTVEMKAGDEGLTERVVNNPVNNDFLLSVTELNNNSTNYRNNWFDLNTVMTNLQTSGVVTDYATNLYRGIGFNANWSDIVTVGQNWSQNVVLQPAVAHLGFNTRSYAAKDIFRNATTNIARYVINADGTVTLSTAAQSYDANGVLTTDYVRLTGTSVKKGQNVFTADLPTTYNRHVDALSDTEFYIVSDSGVEHVVGYSNLPKIDDIRSMYAVARNTSVSNDKDKLGYWVAEVIVIEADNYSAQPDDYLIILGRADYNSQAQANSRQAVGTQNVLAISAKQGGEIRITPTSYNWGSNTVVPGVYKAYGVAEVESGLYTVNNLRKVNTRNVNDARDSQSVNTSAFNLRAGTVTKLWDMEDRIEVSMPGESLPRQLDLKGSALSLVQKSNGYITIGHRMNGDYRSNLVAAGNDIIWVEDSSGNALFTIDVTYSNKNSANGSTVKTLLTTIFTEVCASQQDKHTVGDHTVTIKYNDTGASAHKIENRVETVNNHYELRLTGSLLAPEGFKSAVTNSGSISGLSVYLAGTTTPASGGNGCYVVANDVAGYVIRDITANLDVVLDVTAEDYTVVKDSSATWGGTITAEATCTDKTVPSYTMKDISSTGLTAHAGDVVTVVLGDMSTVNGASYSLTATYGAAKTAVDVTKTAADTFTFTMPAGNVTLTPKYAAPDFTVNFVNTDGIDLTNYNKGVATPNNLYSFTATAKKGWTLNGTYKGTISTGTKLTSVAGVYTIAPDAVVNGLTITFDATQNKSTVDIKSNPGAPAIENSITHHENVTADQTIVFTVASRPGLFDIDLGATGATWTYREYTNENRTEILVSGIAYDGEITVTTK